MHNASSTDPAPLRLQQGKTSLATGRPNSPKEIQAVSKEVTDLKLSVDLLEKERDFYFVKLRDIEILCQTPKLENLPIAVAVKKILYGADAKESLGEAQEIVSQSMYDEEDGAFACRNT